MAAVQLQRKVLILGLILGTLASAYVLGLIFSPVNVQKRRSELPLFSGLKTDQVKAIKVTGPEGSVQMEKREERWVVLIDGEPFPASDSRIGSFFDHLASLKRNRMVSANPESWKSFEVDQAAKRRVKLLDGSGNALVDLIVGKIEQGERGSYVRLEGTNEVILVNRSLDFYLEPEASFWSHLKLFGSDVKGSDIMRISVRSNVTFSDGSARRLGYTLIQSQEGGRGWRLIEPASQKQIALDNKKVDRMANAAADFEGSKFVVGGSARDTGLASPAAELLFSTVNNKDYRILIGSRSGEDQYYAKVDGAGYLYLAPEWRLKSVLQPLEELEQAQENK